MFLLLPYQSDSNYFYSYLAVRTTEVTTKQVRPTTPATKEEVTTGELYLTIR